MECTRQAPPSMGFSRQEYWSELTFPTPRDLAGPGIEPVSPALAGWRRDPLTRENQSQETPTGQQQPTAAHSVNLHPAV